MKAKVLLTIMCVLGLAILGFPGDKDDVYKSGPGIFQLDPFLMENLPGTEFYPFFIENYVPDATLLIEENNGFSLMDNPRVYFEGNSYINFNWFYNGLNINSALNDGTPALLLPFSSVSAYRMQGESPRFRDSGLNFITRMPERNVSRATASTVFSDLGGYWLTFMIQPDHPKTRADRLYNERRKIDGNFFLDYMLGRASKSSQFILALNYFDIKRQFNDFNVFDQTYVEDGRLLTANTRFRKQLSGGYFEFFGLFNYLDRSNQLAELGSYPQETIEKKRSAFLAGATLKKKKLHLALSFQLEKEELTPFEPNFSKDLLDVDGDGVYPYGKSGQDKLGDFSAATVNANLKLALTPAESRFAVRAFADMRYSSISGDETHHDSNGIFFDNTPYQVVKWSGGQSYRNTNLSARAGVKLSASLSPAIALLAKLYLNHNALDFENGLNNISFSRPGFDIGLEFFRNKRSRLLLSFGRTPYDIRENVNFFLEQERPYGTIYHWNDNSGDNLYQPGEEAGVYGYTGGRYRYVDENLTAPVKERLMLHFSTPISKNYVLNIKALYKRIRDPFRVKFDREYGFYETREGQELYFFTQPFTDYYLSNGGYEKDPFYAQFHFNFKGGKPGKWFFSFSFMAHMGMGVTAFGNGPGSSDIGILDESQANPNSWINGFGRLDGDRGFVAKSYFGFYLAKKLFLGVSLKYRDGNPFAFFNTISLYGQRVIYYDTIKAEDEKGVKGGPREDYVADVSVKLNYRFKLLNRDAMISLTLFNILDFGAELSEYVFSGGSRDALELQIPRSVRLTFCWRF